MTNPKKNHCFISGIAVFTCILSACSYNKSVPYYFSKKIDNNVRYLIEHDRKNNKTDETAFYIDSLLASSDSIVGNNCNLEFTIDDKYYEKVYCYFGMPLHYKKQLRDAKNQDSLNQFDVSDNRLCILFYDLSDSSLFPSYISIKVRINVPIFIGGDSENKTIITSCFWAPMLDNKPNVKDINISLDLYMWEGWNHNSNFPFAHIFLDNWVGDHYCFEYVSNEIETFYNDEMILDDIILNYGK